MGKAPRFHGFCVARQLLILQLVIWWSMFCVGVDGQCLFKVLLFTFHYRFVINDDELHVYRTLSSLPSKIQGCWLELDDDAISATHHYSSVHPIASYGPPIQAPELCVAERDNPNMPTSLCGTQNACFDWVFRWRLFLSPKYTMRDLFCVCFCFYMSCWRQSKYCVEDQF